MQLALGLPVTAVFEGKVFCHLDTPAAAMRATQQIQRQIGTEGLEPVFFDGSDHLGGFRISSTTVYTFGSRRRIEGFMSYRLSGPAADVGTLSNLEGIGTSQVTDLDGAMVSRDRLKSFPGYRDYTGQGQLATVELFGCYYPGNGFGSIAMRFLQSRENIEMIELAAMDLDAVRFYERHGFIDPGIDALYGDHTVRVWMNPNRSADPLRTLSGPSISRASGARGELLP